MRIFYSELAANPAYYAYGYSIYGELEAGDDIAGCYAAGFLPFVGAREQPERCMYQVRSVRTRVQEFLPGHYHRYAAQKGKAFIDTVTIHEYQREAVLDMPHVQAFLEAYFMFRFGKGSMPTEKIAAMLQSPLLTHIVEYRLQGKPVGYVLETRGDDFHHVWYYAYAKAYEKQCLGLYLFMSFIERAKAAGKEFAYLGATYGTWMRYKTHFGPLEFWDGATWIDDPKAKQLKKLLSEDSVRQVAFVDAWRDARKPYVRSPYPFTAMKQEMRFLMTVLYATPRVAGVLMCLLGLVLLSITVSAIR